MARALVNGIHLHYEVVGQGTPLVFVHEFAGDGASWRPQVQAFARRYRTITFNARGYPPSDVPDDAAAYSQDHAVADLTAYPELLEPAAALLVVTAVFWRTRFKYALRGYRFALLEAGHVGQNVALASAALELAALPVGGVYDRRLEEVLGVDGVNESVVYLFALGRPEVGT